jgi:putative Holliday junction resolvase
VNPAADATVLAFDFGTRRIGVAVGNTLLRVAQPLLTIEGSPADSFTAIAVLVREWMPGRLVVGLPTHADGTPHAMTVAALRFARQLGERFALPVATVDERWTTEVAQDQLAAAGKGGREGRALRDQVAAQLILQAWFDDCGARSGNS